MKISRNSSHRQNRQNSICRPSTVANAANADQIFWNTSTPVLTTDVFEELELPTRRTHSNTNSFSFDQSCFTELPFNEAPEVLQSPDDCCLPQFEEVLELDKNLEQMPAHKLKQFLFLHSVVNSSSDDSQFTDSGTESEEYWIDNPPSAGGGFYRFDVVEVPIPLEGQGQQVQVDPEEDVKKMLTEPQVIFYSVPLSIKHLLCTHDNLMGLCENITLERIVRRRTLSKIIPMSSEGVRRFFPLEVDFSSSKEGCNDVVNVCAFIQTLSNNFQRKLGSFFNTTFQFSYKFNCGKFYIKYGIFDDNFDFTFGSNLIDLHAFSRYLPETDERLDDKGLNSRRKKRCHKTSRAWKTFVTMAEVFTIIDYMLKGKFSWVQNNRKLLDYISKGGSIKVASKQYDTTVRKNQQRILSNVRKYIRNKELMPLKEAKERNIMNDSQLEFHNGLYDQIIGFYENIGRELPQSRVKMYVIELNDLEAVIAQILDKYVYEQYEVTADHDNASNYKT
ncbi:hypothetical protein ZYGR_0P01570 [Zygosaccharomyces rouxii]|uniref:ZYRO0E04026p n=2 Tax=Zygosaccharomyces rouxii TaxID=4956 RepID=C5E494_ZYGRC|nr:uncharacterized protein ZYRO0E04026g [Zygosaccharomyces rouxii]KAH9198288.1 hypothetical protein LQ764DRAFT_214772 [Zygosaccharomyces rouxii]GAV49513.1 hypothetical protein ZYGR_0P01570 [Zygosaccharomyces rouxii]CAR30855.1 ZYRO0E04026p [Zygosaccharomyces rouxii]